MFSCVYIVSAKKDILVLSKDSSTSVCRLEAILSFPGMLKLWKYANTHATDEFLLLD